MARLLTTGVEVEYGAFTGSGPDGVNDGQSGTTSSRITSLFRTGSASVQCASGVGNSAAWLHRGGNPAGSATTYMRVYFCFANLPGSTVKVFEVNNGSVGGLAPIAVKLTSGGVFQLWNLNTNSQIGSDSATTVTADGATWYRVEVSATLDATPNLTACEFRLNGATVASASGLSISSGQSFAAGWCEAPGASQTCYLDDLAVNDGSGAAQNTWPGDGKVVLLLPASDNAKGTGWTNDAASSTSLFPSVKNTPPTGIADTTTGSGLHQIRNATSNANSNYDANLTTYAVAGIGASDTVNLLVPVVATAAPVVTSAKAGTFGISTNPAIANVSLGAGGTAGAFWSGTAAGTYSTGWKWSFGTTTYAPTVTLATAPVARITQVTSSTRVAMVCFMGMYVDYTPAIIIPPTPLVHQSVPFYPIPSRPA